MRNRGGILVATDVAARGIDLSAVDLIISYDLPDNAELFTHRAGRTARAGKSGKSFTLVNTTLQRERLAGFFAETGNYGTYYALTTVDNYGKPEKDSASRAEERGLGRQDFERTDGGENVDERFGFRPERPKNERRIAKSGHIDGRGGRDFDKKKGSFRKGADEKFDRSRKGGRFSRGAEFTYSGKKNGFSRGGEPDRKNDGGSFDRSERFDYKRGGERFDRKGGFDRDKKYDRAETQDYGKNSGYSDSGYGKKSGGKAFGTKKSAGKPDYRGAGKPDYRGAGKPDYRGAGKPDYRGAGKNSDYRKAGRPQNSRGGGKKSGYQSAGKKPAFRGAGTPDRKPFKKG